MEQRQNERIPNDAMGTPAKRRRETPATDERKEKGNPDVHEDTVAERKAHRPNRKAKRQPLLLHRQAATEGAKRLTERYRKGNPESAVQPVRRQRLSKAWER